MLVAAAVAYIQVVPVLLEDLVVEEKVEMLQEALVREELQILVVEEEDLQVMVLLLLVVPVVPVSSLSPILHKYK
jgi:hypothetical protein